jgi:hypothetical protein
MLADLAPADGPGQVALRAWPRLAARHPILDDIGCLLANRENRAHQIICMRRSDKKAYHLLQIG